MTNPSESPLGITVSPRGIGRSAARHPAPTTTPRDAAPEVDASRSIEGRAARLWRLPGFPRHGPTNGSRATGGRGGSSFAPPYSSKVAPYRSKRGARGPCFADVPTHDGAQLGGTAVRRVYTGSGQGRNEKAETAAKGDRGGPALLLLGLARCCAHVGPCTRRQARVATLVAPAAGLAVHSGTEGAVHGNGRLFYAVHGTRRGRALP